MQKHLAKIDIMKKNNLIEKNLSPYQKRYWKNPEHCRQLQRNKYRRYPERIKERNAKWAAENAEYLKVLKNFNVSIFYHRKRGNDAKVSQLLKAKEEFKKSHKTK